MRRGLDAKLAQLGFDAKLWRILMHTGGGKNRRSMKRTAIYDVCQVKSNLSPMAEVRTGFPSCPNIQSRCDSHLDHESGDDRYEISEFIRSSLESPGNLSDVPVIETVKKQSHSALTVNVLK